MIPQDSARRVGLLHAIAGCCDDVVFGSDPALIPWPEDHAGWVRQLVVALGNLGAASDDDTRLDELVRFLGLGLAWAEAISREQAR